MDTSIAFERTYDNCPICRVSGMAPCVDEKGNDTPGRVDHPGRPVDQASSRGVYCAVCGEPEGSLYAKPCCTDDNMIEA